MPEAPTNVYIAVTTTWVAAFVALILRVISRRMTRRQWWVDDYLCACAFTWASAYSILLIIWAARWNLGQALDPSLTEDQREWTLLHARRLMFCSEFCYAFSIASTKFALLTLYWRLFKMSSIRIPIQIMFTISVTWIILRTFMVAFQCLPTQYFWNKSIHGHCAINESHFFFGTILTHCVMDVVILALPVIEVAKLHLPLRERLAVIGLFFIGFFVCIASVITVVESIRYNPGTTEMPRDVAPNFIWGNVEINVAVVSACTPFLRPVFRHIFQSLSSNGTSQPISRTAHSDIKLNSVQKTKVKVVNQSSSTDHLTKQDRDPSCMSEFWSNSTTQTVIYSRSQNSRRYSDGGCNMSGIHVRNNVVVEVEEVERPDNVISNCHTLGRTAVGK